MCFTLNNCNIVRLFLFSAITSNIYVSSVTDDSTYFLTRQLSGQQYGLEYNLKNYTSVERIANRPRILFDWSKPSSPREKTVENTQVQVDDEKKIDKHVDNEVLDKEQVETGNTMEIDDRRLNVKQVEKEIFPIKKIEELDGVVNTERTAEEKISTENAKEIDKFSDNVRIENNVWWPWKNYDDWLNGRGLKTEEPKKKEKKTRKEKKNRKKNKKAEKKRKKPKTGKKQTNGGNAKLSINVEINEIKNKGSLPEIKYKASPIDIMLKNSSLVPTLVKYTSRNYTYDVNECLTNNGGCEGLCINTPGSYRCHCPPGFMVADTKCEDIDECLLRNGHGPCQGTCTNTWGGYKCSCHSVPGTKLADDKHTCTATDRCRDGTAGCSHQCINTLGSSFCVCPDGLQLDNDWKTCVDVDECSDPDLQPDRCADGGMSCLNTHGSYKCV